MQNDLYSYIPIPVPEDQGIHIKEHTYFIGVDLGQVDDYTAITVLERVITGEGYIGYRQEGERAYSLRHIERPPRGTEYPAVVDRLVELFNDPRLAAHEKAVCVDLTGVGRPVYDLMFRAGFWHSINAVSITGGDTVSFTDGHWNVPKRDLVTNLQVLLQNNALKIARGLPEAAALIEELSSFQTKIKAGGRDTYGGRGGVHDDIVLSLSLAAWLAMQRRPSLGNIGYM